MVGILGDDGSQPVAAQQVTVIVTQVQRDSGATARLLGRFQRVLAAAVGGPTDRLARGQAGPPRGQLHPVRHDERGVEAHPELPDEGRVLPLIARQGLEELPCSRLGDGADVLDHLGPAHPDPVIGDRDRRRVHVDPDADLQWPLVLRVLALGQQLQPQPVDGIRRVRDQLAQEDLLVAVQRIDHQVQELDHLRLEAERLLVLHRHRVLP